jgi:transcription factor 1
MEPDTEAYMKYLQPLLDQEGSKYKLFPGSGIVWENLNQLETGGYLPHQKLLAQGDPRLEQPNNTLLFVANLGFYPNKAYQGFSSATTLMIHQLMTAIRAHSLFQGYGLVRMLVWMQDKEKSSVLPRMISARKKSTLEAEISCKNIFEIAGLDESHSGVRREHIIDLESAKAVTKKTSRVNMETPKGRMGTMEKALKEGLKVFIPYGDDVARPYYKELQELEERYAKGIYRDANPTDPANLNPSGRPGQVSKTRSAEYDRLRYLRGRAVEASNRAGIVESMIFDYEYILDKYAELRKKGITRVGESQCEVQQMLSNWKDRLYELSINTTKVLIGRIDDRRALRQNPPILLWDRREAEPLIVRNDEFFPKRGMCLLDFHPKTLWPILRGKNITSYDYFEYIANTLFMNPTQPITRGLSSLSSGAADWIIPRCPSLTDTANGGVISLDQLSVRTLNQKMLQEITDAWMDWPFRLTKPEIVWRMGATDMGDPYSDEEKELGVFMG